MVQFGRQREHDVEVGDRQDALLALSQPVGLGQPLALGTVPVPTGVVGHLHGPAGVAYIDMAAQGGGPAGQDRFDDLALGQRDRVGLEVVGGMRSEDVGDL